MDPALGFVSHALRRGCHRRRRFYLRLVSIPQRCRHHHAILAEGTHSAFCGCCWVYAFSCRPLGLLGKVPCAQSLSRLWHGSASRHHYRRRLLNCRNPSAGEAVPIGCSESERPPKYPVASRFLLAGKASTACSTLRP